MRLVVVSYWYAPAVAPRAFRWTALAEHWAARGHEVSVVAGWWPGMARDEVRGGVRVHRVGANLPARVRGALRRPAPAAAAGKPEERPLGVRLARGVYDRTWKKVYWPDFAAPWYFAASRAAGHLASGCDGIVTVSDPFTCHLVGEALHRRAPGVPWVMDVGDPFSFLEHTPTNNRALYRGLNTRAERRAFAAARAVAVTTCATRDLYARHFAESAAKVRVIPPLAPAMDGIAPHPRVFADDGRVRLVFCGTLYRSIRDPAHLLRLFESLREAGAPVELHFLGNARECMDLFQPYEHRLGNGIFLHGPVSREYTLQAMREASVLVNLGNATPFQLPSKLLEYVALGKPVLNLARSRQDSSAELLRSYPAALTLVEGEDEPAPADAARHLHDLLARPPVDVAGLGWLRDYRVDAVAGAYERLLSA